MRSIACIVVLVTGAAAAPLGCNNVNFTGPRIRPPFPRCIDSVHPGNLTWTDRRYGFVSAPEDFLDGEFSYYMTELDGPVPCGSRGGGFRGSVNQDAVIGVCCPSHMGPQPGPATSYAVPRWTLEAGSFELSNHGGTPCNFYHGRMRANTSALICCRTGWTSGAFFGTVPPPATTPQPTTTGPYMDVNDSFHLAFAEINAVANETSINSAFRSEVSILISLVVATQDDVNNNTMMQMTLMNNTLSSTIAAQSTVAEQSVAVSNQLANLQASVQVAQSTATAVSDAISRAVAATPTATPSTAACTATGTCQGSVYTGVSRLVMSQPDGTVAIETGTCGTVDLCAVVSALGALRGN